MLSRRISQPSNKGCFVFCTVDTGMVSQFPSKLMSRQKKSSDEANPPNKTESLKKLAGQLHYSSRAFLPSIHQTPGSSFCHALVPIIFVESLAASHN